MQVRDRATTSYLAMAARATCSALMAALFAGLVLGYPTAGLADEPREYKISGMFTRYVPEHRLLVIDDRQLVLAKGARIYDARSGTQTALSEETLAHMKGPRPVVGKYHIGTNGSFQIVVHELVFVRKLERFRAR